MRIKKFLSWLSGFWTWLRRRIPGYRMRHGADVKYKKLKTAESQTNRNDVGDESPVSYLNLVSVYTVQRCILTVSEIEAN